MCFPVLSHMGMGWCFQVSGEKDYENFIWGLSDLEMQMKAENLKKNSPEKFLSNKNITVSSLYRDDKSFNSPGPLVVLDSSL